MPLRDGGRLGIRLCCSVG